MLCGKEASTGEIIAISANQIVPQKFRGGTKNVVLYSPDPFSSWNVDGGLGTRLGWGKCMNMVKREVCVCMGGTQRVTAYYCFQILSLAIVQKALGQCWEGNVAMCCHSKIQCNYVPYRPEIKYHSSVSAIYHCSH